MGNQKIMYDGKDLTDVFKKVISAFSEDKSLGGKLLDSWGKGRNEFVLSDLADGSCNHICDDHPEWFGITRKEGQLIREYFHIKNEEQYSSEIYSVFGKYFNK